LLPSALCSGGAGDVQHFSRWWPGAAYHGEHAADVVVAGPPEVVLGHRADGVVNVTPELVDELISERRNTRQRLTDQLSKPPVIGDCFRGHRDRVLGLLLSRGVDSVMPGVTTRNPFRHMPETAAQRGGLQPGGACLAQDWWRFLGPIALHRRHW
jgi:hypothetical protein